MSLFYVLLRLVRCDVAKPLLVGLSVINCSFFNCGQDDEKISIQFFGQQTACKIFVNDSTGSLQVIPLTRDRNPAASAGGFGEATTRRYPLPASSRMR